MAAAEMRQLLARALQAAFIPIDHGDMGPGQRQIDGDGPSDAAAPAGDDADPAREAEPIGRMCCGRGLFRCVLRCHDQRPFPCKVDGRYLSSGVRDKKPLVPHFCRVPPSSPHLDLRQNRIDSSGMMAPKPVPAGALTPSNRHAGPATTITSARQIKRRDCIQGLVPVTLGSSEPADVAMAPVIQR
jgi:hypothetical protein